MDRFNGLDIPETLADALRPQTLALVVYDMQVGILRQIADGGRVLANVQRVLAAARARAVRTVFLRHYFMPTELAGVYQLRQAKVWQGKATAAETRPLIPHGSAGFVRGSLEGRRADVAYLGVGQLGLQDEEYIRTYWAETVRAVGARRVVLIHWDDFFRPLDRPLRALPYAGDDLDATMRVLVPLAERDGVSVHFPTLWRYQATCRSPA